MGPEGERSGTITHLQVWHVFRLLTEFPSVFSGVACALMAHGGVGTARICGRCLLFMAARVRQIWKAEGKLPTGAVR